MSHLVRVRGSDEGIDLDASDVTAKSVFGRSAECKLRSEVVGTLLGVSQLFSIWRIIKNLASLVRIHLWLYASYRLGAVDIQI